MFGSNPKGILIFDRSGHYFLTILRSDLPKFAAGTSDHGTAAKNQAALAGMIASFGTDSLNEADGTLTTDLQGSSFANLTGGEQKRVISSLTESDLKYTNATTSTPTKAELTWKRAK